MGLFKRGDAGARAEIMAEKLRDGLQGALGPNEEIKGVCIATQTGMVKGRMVAVGVTEDRLLLQPMTRKWEPDGRAAVLTGSQIASAQIDGGGGLSSSLAAVIMDGTTVTLKLKTVDGETWKLMMMKGTGVLGGFGGGEVQKQGLEALAEWFSRADNAL